MVMETLKGLTEIQGKKIMTNEDRPVHSAGGVDWEAFDRMREDFPICIDHETDTISLKMLTKPASEGGNLNLCQCVDLIALGLHQLKELNRFYPCRENAISITKFEEGLMWQRERTREREQRGVEGTNQQ